MDQCLSLPFDQFQRYKLVSDIINKFRTGERKFKILDVGAGFEENLKKFLPLDDIYYLDKEYPPEYFQKEHFISGDIFKTEFHDKYDFIVAIDVYEHIPQINRKKFIDILILLSDIATIIAAPFDLDDVKKCEFFANEVYRNSHGSDYIWLKEHIENGLPSLADTQNLIRDNHLSFVILPNGYLPRWFEMISAFLLTEGKPEFQPMMTTLYELYNQNYYEYDNRNPAYRQVIVIPKGDQIIDFSDLAAKKDDPVEIINKNLLLGSFIEKIKMTSVQISDKQIIEFRQHAHNLEAIIVDRETQIADFRLHARNLETVVTEQNSQIAELKLLVRDLEATVADRDRQIAELKLLVRDLEATVTDRDNKIVELRQHARNLEFTVADRDNKIVELRQHARNLEFTVADRDNQIAELRQHACNLEAIITDRDQQLQEFIRFNQSLSNENLSMKQSITYNLTTKFHKKIVERLLPPNTQRRKYYNLGLTGSRLLVTEGWDRFWWCYRERKQPHLLKIDPVIPLQPPEKETLVLESIPVIQTKISVIIPTKNAGPDFPTVLEKIKNQKGIASIEIIIVDSGSNDGTCEVAERSGCRVFLIKPEEFNHGLTRNYGAEQASGEFIVFLVQDAIPIGDYWLHKMVNFFEIDKKIAAITCRQVPRSDSDLFAGFILWLHYKSLNRTQNRIYSCETRFDELSSLNKRITAGIEDTCCMMQKKIFDQFKFRNIQYGEDLDIGIRLLKAGNKTAFVFSTGVIHSHTRDPNYFFKRSFVDTLVLDSLLNNSQKPIDNNISLKDLMEQVLGLYSIIRQNVIIPGDKSFSGTQVINHLKKAIQSPDIGQKSHPFFFDTEQLVHINPVNKLEVFLTECARLAQANSLKYEYSLIASYCEILDSFSEYCSVYSSLEGRETELSESFEKLFALIAGSTLATNYCKKPHNQLSESESALMKILEDGI
jgi:glycosyltransferase involved in cell wall biosynthesis